MTKYKLLTSNGSKIIYNFDTLDGTGTFSIDKKDNSIELLSTECYLKNRKMNKENLDHILFVGKKKIVEMNFPESCVYATH
ncbi:MAG: hypothetical protein J6X78_13040 [Treponema sp.]|nr:hypothetical protein [Treponema sp.]